MKKALNIISTVLVVIVVVLAILLAGVRLIGYQPFAVLSSSMSPTFYAGDMVYVRGCEPENIQVGDTITFRAYDDTFVTHRVAEKDAVHQRFYTKGDANANRDGSPVAYGNVCGVVKFSISKLGYVSTFIMSDVGKYITAAAVILLIALFLLPELFKKSKPEKGEDENSSDDTVSSNPPTAEQ